MKFESFKDFVKEYGSDTTTNFELISIAKELGIPNFYVLMRDELSQLNELMKENKEINLICNLHTQKQKGIHWSCSKFSEDKVYWFDSYGLPMLSNELMIPNLQMNNFPI